MIYFTTLVMVFNFVCLASSGIEPVFSFSSNKNTTQTADAQTTSSRELPTSMTTRSRIQITSDVYKDPGTINVLETTTKPPMPFIHAPQITTSPTPPPLVSDFPSLWDIKTTEDLLSKMEFLDNLTQFMMFDQLLYCPNVGLCTVRGRETHFSVSTCCSSCSCHSECSIAGNCCPDVIETKKQEYPTNCVHPQLKSYTETHVESKQSYMIVDQCIRVDLNKPKYESCKISSKILTLHDLEQQVPVTSKATKVTYLNKQCAFCHGEEDGNLLEWSISLTCNSHLKGNSSTKCNSVDNYLETVIANKFCNIIYEPLSIHGSYDLQSCDWGYISSCNASGTMATIDPDIEIACHSYTSVYQNIYRNIFCYMCNDNSSPKMECQESLKSDFVPFTFSGLLDIGMLRAWQDKPPEGDMSAKTDLCAPFQRYDGLKDVCRDITCSDGSFYLNGKCKNVLKENENKYILELNLVPDNNAHVICHSCGEEIVQTLDQFISDNPLYKEYVKHTCEVILYGVQGNSSLLSDMYSYFILRIEFAMTLYHYPNVVVENLLQIKHKMLKFVDAHDISYSTSFSFPKKMKSPVSGPKIHHSERRMPILHHNFLLRDFSCFEPKKTVAVHRLTTCPIVSLTDIEVNYTVDNDKVCMEDIDLCLGLSDVVLGNETISLCADEYFNRVDQILKESSKSRNPCGESSSVTYDKVVSILIIVWLFLSILCHFITFVTYSLFKTLQSLPGKVNMALCMNIMLGQIFGLVGNNISTTADVFCKVVGALTHYFWLSSAFWMNICTIHMFIVFVHILSECKAIHENTKSKFIKYCMYAQVIALLLVLANVSISLSFTSYRDTGYGVCACFISSELMLFTTFVVPLGIVFICNIVLFLMVVIRIHRLPTVTSNIRSKRNNVLVYVKLSILTGMTWAFAFLYEFTKVSAFSYISIIFNGGQGVFIMFAFICNKRVCKLYRRLFGQGTVKSDKSNLTLTTNQSHAGSTTTLNNNVSADLGKQTDTAL